MVCCPRTMTQQQWSAYKARIIREAHQQQAAVIRAAFACLFASIARLVRQPHPQRRPSEAEA